MKYIKTDTLYSSISTMLPHLEPAKHLSNENNDIIVQVRLAEKGLQTNGPRLIMRLKANIKFINALKELCLTFNTPLEI